MVLCSPSSCVVGTLYQAYAWGFDICSWQQHLNPLTWPEILRQLALSGGLGPQQRKGGNAEPAHHDENEVKFFCPALKNVEAAD